MPEAALDRHTLAGSRNRQDWKLHSSAQRHRIDVKQARTQEEEDHADIFGCELSNKQLVFSCPRLYSFQSSFVCKNIIKLLDVGL